MENCKSFPCKNENQTFVLNPVFPYFRISMFMTLEDLSLRPRKVVKGL
jgi:hypothetical protein